MASTQAHSMNPTMKAVANTGGMSWKPVKAGDTAGTVSADATLARAPSACDFTRFIVEVDLASPERGGDARTKPTAAETTRRGAPMSAFLGFLLGRPVLIAGIVGALLIGGFGVQTARLHHAKADQIDPDTQRKWKDEYREQRKALQAAQTSLTTCRANESSLRQAIDSQNSGIESTVRAANAGKAAADAAIANARAQNAKLDQVLRDLRAARPKGSDLCGSADDLIRSFAR